MKKYQLIVKGVEGIEDWTDSVSANSLEEAVLIFSQCLDIPYEVIKKCVSEVKK